VSDLRRSVREKRAASAVRAVNARAIARHEPASMDYYHARRWAPAAALAIAGPLLGCYTDEPGSASLPIVGGAVDVDHDAVVAVIRPDGTCSGTLIEAAGGSGLVLTAAHCLMSPTGYSVVIGDDYSAPEAVLTVAGVHVHPAFAGIASGHDIAVLRVSGVPEGAATLAPLRASEDRLGVGSDYLAIGYGTRNAAGTERTTVRHVARIDVHSVGFNRIFSTWGDGAPCAGDSGGAVVRRIDGEERLVAVHVIGMDACDETATSGHERVAYYEDFIDSVARSRPLGCGTCRQASSAACEAAHLACGEDDGCGEYRRCLEECLDLDDACASACVRANTGGAALFADTVGACQCGDVCGEVCEHE
jgi:hypothetical protein